MTRRFLLLGGVLLVLVAACTPRLVETLQTLMAALPESAAPLGGEVAALPTPDPDAATPTPPPSIINLPTPAPTVAGPLATLTAIAGIFPTQDLSATPYAIALEGRLHFVEFHAWW